jgi:D-xylose transport system ATP-binding protein
LLRLEGICKNFGAVRALEGVSFAIHAGEAVALLGDNGAGKSTLVKIISGSMEPDAGRMYFAGRPVRLRSPAQAKGLGIETVYQDLSLCPNVDVVANFFMGRELQKKILGIPLLDEGRMQSHTEQALADLGAAIGSVRTRIEHLSGGQRQAIELCRFVHWGGRLALLDEPFAALGLEQTRRGLELINRVKAQGVAVLVITHNLLHAFRVADRAVVLRQGRLAGVRGLGETSPEELAALITGDSLQKKETETREL